MSFDTRYITISGCCCSCNCYGVNPTEHMETINNATRHCNIGTKQGNRCQYLSTNDLFRNTRYSISGLRTNQTRVFASNILYKKKF